jgi:energy-coupling factor transporter ATP-binding protein EcfA2
MLRQLRLRNFRSFRDFTIVFGDGAYLVGPNNAGKSTILTALRTADVLLRYAQQRNPTLAGVHNDRHYVAYPIFLRDFPALLESVRYDFRGEEASFQLTWKSEARLTAVWPQVGDEYREPFFYLEKQPGVQVRGVTSARSTFPGLGVIPILVPVEHTEELRDDEYVKRSISGRLSSRHFRNQLRLMRENETYEGFVEFARPWLEGLTIESFGQHMGDNGQVLDVFYREADSRVPKELVWAGDGIQVWLQLLYHVYRVRDFDTIVLDEPEVYLHPDLQRKLVHLLETTERQVVLATHSSEVIAEANPNLITLVEKSRKRALRAKSDAELQMMSSALGSAFNLRLAKALKSDVALFVEGDDMSIVNRLARTLALQAIANEQGVTVIPLKGYSRWGEVAPFAWLARELLSDALRIFVILDRDYRPDSVVTEVEKAFAKDDITAHVWRRKELESYLLTPEVIARLAGGSLATVTEIINSVTAEMGDYVFSQMLGERVKVEVSAKRDATEVTGSFKKEFDQLWRNAEYRLHVAPAKRVLSGVNRQLAEAKLRPIMVHNLAVGHRVEEISPEFSGMLRRVEDAVGARSWSGPMRRKSSRGN